MATGCNFGREKWLSANTLAERRNRPRKSGSGPSDWRRSWSKWFSSTLALATKLKPRLRANFIVRSLSCGAAIRRPFPIRRSQPLAIIIATSRLEKRTCEPVSATCEPSLGERLSDIENSPLETARQKLPIKTRSAEISPLRDRLSGANVRKCREHFRLLEVRYGDGTGWLGQRIRTLESRDAKAPLGLGLTPTEGRSARNLVGRKDWTSAANGASVSPCR